MAEGMHGKGACVAGGTCVAGCVCGRGVWQGAGETATAEDGMHPTGMHSFINIVHIRHEPRHSRTAVQDGIFIFLHTI